MSKLEFFRKLNKQGWPTQKIMDIYKFLDIILVLNKTLEKQYDETARKLDKELGMNLMISWERQGYEKGIAQGEVLGGAEILANQLKAKFNNVPETYLSKIRGADLAALNKWSVNLIFANSLEEVFKVQ